MQYIEDKNDCLSRLEQRFMMLCCAAVASAADGGRSYFPLLESGLWWSALVRRMVDLAWSCFKPLPQHNMTMTASQPTTSLASLSIEPV